MKKRDYKSKDNRFFIDFLPQEVFDNLSTENRKNYKLYRDNHRYIHQGEQQILDWKKEIDKLKKKIKDKELQIKGSDDGKGWKDKMLEGYSQIGYLSKEYEFWCSVNLRKRKSKTLVHQEKGFQDMMRKNYKSDVSYGDGSKDGKNVNNPSKSFEEFKQGMKVNEYKTPFIPPQPKYYEKYYIRIEPKSKSWVRNLYVGSKEDVIVLLKTGIKEVEWEKKNEKYLRDNLREIYKGYVRYQIHKDGVEKFQSGDLSKHPSDMVLSWIGEMGDEMFEWMDK
ncbi:hypothetical protein [Maribacter sp. ACAM166]|uniref:hypothetical protein n=1 Tax=Maribacter sp. ACAM166 TaxID=2508996 RepID=UPI0010FEE3A8|nr:hypothetical protein [Maribacter sp. ACAM166]TLP73241.1 hypothetical protein ES765_17410 [Maribacter sp. ACAM166]